MEVALSFLISLMVTYGDGEPYMKSACFSRVGYGHSWYFLRTPTAHPCENNARATFYDMLAAFLINVARYYGVME
jgi:hypothetical protein